MKKSKQYPTPWKCTDFCKDSWKQYVCYLSDYIAVWITFSEIELLHCSIEAYIVIRFDKDNDYGDDNIKIPINLYDGRQHIDANNRSSTRQIKNEVLTFAANKLYDLSAISGDFTASESYIICTKPDIGDLVKQGTRADKKK